MDMNEEQVMDAAISDVLTCETPADLQGSDADEATRRTERSLRETVARLSAASPFMKPAPELRARILQASAPKSYKIEDYRKVGAEDFRWYKWGFYAAAAFLILGAMYNINMAGKLQQANDQTVAIENQANDLLKKQAAQFAATSRERDAALAAFIDPRGVPVTWMDNTTEKPFGRGIINPATHQALLIFPQEMIPAGVHPQLTVKDSAGQPVAYDTTLIVAPAGPLGLVVPKNGPTFAKVMQIQKLAPDEKTVRPQIATFGGN